MTALSEYQRLESTGLWKDSADSQRREVLVSLGDATLVISTLSETALSHWSLPAVRRLNPGTRPALFAPDAGTQEELEIADADMIEAIERVRSAIAKQRPHPGRLRLYLAAGISLLTLLIVVIWLPEALLRQTASVLPPATRAAFGQAILADMEDLAGSRCHTPEGDRALQALSSAVFGAETAPQLVVLPSTAQNSVSLPGNIMVLNRGLVEDFEGPEATAGFLLAEDLRRTYEDPTEHLLETAGIFATLRLLTTGILPASKVQIHAAALLTTPPAEVSDADLIDRFTFAAISSEPYAYAVDVSGESTLALIEADPLRGRAHPRLIPDTAWVALQEICNE